MLFELILSFKMHLKEAFLISEVDLKDHSLDLRKLKNVLVKRGSWNPDQLSSLS